MTQHTSSAAGRRPGGARRTRELVLIGGGPRATLVLERLAANAAQQSGTVDRPVRVHVIEPFEAGSGRIWRHDQSPLLKLNSMARDVTMFTDETVVAEGPAWDGPSLEEWAAGVADGSIEDAEIDDEDDLRRIRQLRGADFPTRRVHQRYLQWVWRRVVDRALASPGIDDVIVHPTWADEITECSRGGHDVRLKDGTVLHADAAVLLLGHTDALATRGQRRRGAAASASEGSYTRPSYTEEVDWSALGPGQRAVVTGMGLGFIDLMVLLYEGRGGRFRTRDGSADPARIESGEALVYEPSGSEPLLWVGSRRGVPFHSKISTQLRAPFAPDGLQFVTAAAIERLLDENSQLDWDEHLWPLITREAGHHWYREIVLGHPERVRDGVRWEDFARRYAAAGPSELSRLLHETFRDSRDLLDLHAIDRPLEGLTFEDAEQVQEAVLRSIRRDMDERSDPQRSQTLALFLALLHLRVALMDLVPEDRLTEAGLRMMNRWWPGFFSFVDSGPPAHRLQELLALHEAGFVRFLGPDVIVEHDEAGGGFAARSRAGGPWIKAPHFVEARLPGPSMAGTANPVLRSVLAGELGEEQSFPSDDGPTMVTTGKLEVDAQYRVVDRHGRAHPDLFAAGVFTTVPTLGAFARPRQNSEPFRSSDALARSLWQALAGSSADREDAAQQRAIEATTYTF